MSLDEFDDYIQTRIPLWTFSYYIRDLIAAVRAADHLVLQTKLNEIVRAREAYAEARAKLEG
jgi:hypothetical protein